MTLLEAISGFVAILWGLAAITLGVGLALADGETGWGFNGEGWAGVLFATIGLGLCWVGIQVIANAV